MSTVSYERYNPEHREYPRGLYPRKDERLAGQKVSSTILHGAPKKRKTGGKERDLSLRRVFTALIVVLSAILVLEIVFHLVIAPRLSIEHIYVNTGEGVEVTEESILLTAGITGRVHYFSVDPDLIADRLSALPFVREVTVDRVFPDTLSISLVQREAVAAILVDTGGNTVPALVDGEGVLFRLDHVDIDGLPVLSGIRFENPKPGVVLPGVLVHFLGDIERVKRTSPVLLTLISEFKFIKKDGSRYEVLLYPEHYRVPVRIGDRLDERTLNYIMMVLDVVLRQGLTPEMNEIDFRSGDVAFRMREG